MNEPDQYPPGCREATSEFVEKLFDEGETMSDTPTPETDATEPAIGNDRCGWVRADFARKLERERDEARRIAEKYRDLWVHDEPLPWEKEAGR